MVKVTCRFCKKKVDKDKAYPVKHGKTNYYYCNQEHSVAKLPRDLMYEAIFDVFGRKITNSVLYKEFDEMSNIYTTEKVCAYINENKEFLENIMNTKSFNTEYAKIRYFAAIFKNSLKDYEIKEQKQEIKKDVPIEIYESKYKKKKSRKGIDSLLSLLDD